MALQAGPTCRLQLTPTTQLVLHDGMITDFEGDAVVCSGDEHMMLAVPLQVLRNWRMTGNGYSAIHLGAGPALQAACLQVPEVEPGVRCPLGQARMTGAGELAVRHVIHTVGPVYTYSAADAELLGSVYSSCLQLANQHKLRALAFTAISCSAKGYPPEEAAEIALKVCAAAADGVEEIHFYLGVPRTGGGTSAEGPLMDAWLQQAGAMGLPEVPPEPPALERIVRAARAGSKHELWGLVIGLAMELGMASAGGGPIDRPDQAYSSSLPGGLDSARLPRPADLLQQQMAGPPAGAEQEDAGHACGGGNGGGSGGGGCGSAVDVRRWTFAYQDLQKVRPLGAGAFGKVWLASCNGTHYAVKELFWGGGTAADVAGAADVPLSLSQPQLREFKAEAELMAGLRHPHVLNFMGVVLQPPCIVTEYCGQGSLYDMLKKASAYASVAAQLTWDRRLSLLWGIAKGMDALHTHSPPIVHRDLRSPNVLIDRPWVAKVADFGLGRFADGSTGARSALLSSAVDNRNPRWLAPEVLASIMDGRGHPATKASDVYSYSMVMYEVLTWRTPWEEAHHWMVPTQVPKGDRPEVPCLEKLPGVDTPRFGGLDAYLALMRDCWSADPEARPAFGSIASRLHQLLQDHIARQRGGSAALHGS